MRDLYYCHLYPSEFSYLKHRVPRVLGSESHSEGHGWQVSLYRHQGNVLHSDFLSGTLMEKSAAGSEWLVTAARFLDPRKYAHLCTALCYKVKIVSKSFRVSGQACFSISGLLCSFMFYCTREHLQRHRRVGIPCRRSKRKIWALLALAPSV